MKSFCLKNGFYSVFLLDKRYPKDNYWVVNVVVFNLS